MAQFEVECGRFGTLTPLLPIKLYNILKLVYSEAE